MMFGSEWTPIIPAFFTDLSDLETRQPRRQGLHFAQLPLPVAERPLLPAGRQIPDSEKRSYGFTYDAGLSFATRVATEFTPCGGEATWFAHLTDNWDRPGLPTAKGFWTPKNVIMRCMPTAWRMQQGLDVQLAKTGS